MNQLSSSFASPLVIPVYISLYPPMREIFLYLSLLIDFTKPDTLSSTHRLASHIFIFSYSWVVFHYAFISQFLCSICFYSTIFSFAYSLASTYKLHLLEVHLTTLVLLLLSSSSSSFSISNGTDEITCQALWVRVVSHHWLINFLHSYHVVPQKICHIFSSEYLLSISFLILSCC